MIGFAAFAIYAVFNVVSIFVIFACVYSFFCRLRCFLLPFFLRHSPLALRIPPLILRDVGQEHATRHPDFADDAIAVKLWTAQPDSRHDDLCIAHLLDFIYLELVSVSKHFAEALGCVILFTKFVDGVHFVNIDCTHDSGFLDDVTRLWLHLQNFDGEPQELELLLNSFSFAATSAGATMFFDSGKVRVLDCIPAVTCEVALATTTCASSRSVRSNCRAASSKRAR